MRRLADVERRRGDEIAADVVKAKELAGREVLGDDWVGATYR
jgi:hypothetical protein